MPVLDKKRPAYVKQKKKKKFLINSFCKECRRTCKQRSFVKVIACKKFSPL